jgi:hypothetical protein
MLFKFFFFFLSFSKTKHALGEPKYAIKKPNFDYP